MQPITKNIIKKTGPQPGPTLAIFAGMHGNEQAGVLALRKLLPQLKLNRGTAYFAYANVPAITLNVRQVNKNLNRCFLQGNLGDTPEDARARELMAVLDQCDALLDLHGSYGDTDEPFVITEPNGLDIAAKFETGVISTNWSQAEPGASDGYMFERDKIGICFECGPLAKSQEFAPVAERAVWQFLKYFDLVNTHVSYSASPKHIVQATESVVRRHSDFYLDPSLSNFQLLAPGQVLGHDGDTPLVAKLDDVIIFPQPQALIGTEAYVLGRQTSLRSGSDM